MSDSISYPSRYEGIAWTAQDVPFDHAWYAAGDSFHRFADGGYPLAYYCKDGDTLCASCATALVIENRDAAIGWIADGTMTAREARGAFTDSDVIAGADVIHESEWDLLCDSCNTVICKGCSDPRADATYLDDFTTAYVACELWTANDWSVVDRGEETNPDPMDAAHGVEDFDARTLETMRADCRNFVADNTPDLIRSTLDAGRAGHDFSLTRNRHGAGYWDEGYRGTDEATAALTRLTEASHAYGETNYYVNAQGRIESE